MLQPGLANLFEAIVVVGSTAHAIKILRNDAVIRVRGLQPIDLDGSVVARGRGQPQTDLACDSRSKLRQIGQVPDDNIRSRDKTRDMNVAAPGRQDRRLGGPFDNSGDLDRVQGGGDRNLPDDQTSVGWSSELVRQTFRNQKSSALDVEQVRSGIILIETSFDVEEDKASLPIACHETKWLA